MLKHVLTSGIVLPFLLSLLTKLAVSALEGVGTDCAKQPVWSNSLSLCISNIYLHHHAKSLISFKSMISISGLNCCCCLQAITHERRIIAHNL
jgi:hypothetical protein